MAEFCYICDKFDFRCSGGGGSGGRPAGDHQGEEPRDAGFKTEILPDVNVHTQYSVLNENSSENNVDKRSTDKLVMRKN